MDDRNRKIIIGTGGVVALAAEGAVIVYSNLRINPQSITIGDSTEIRVDANNIGDEAGTVEEASNGKQ